MSSSSEATNIDIEKDTSLKMDGVDPNSLRTAVTASNKISEDDSASVTSCESGSSASVTTKVNKRLLVIAFASFCSFAIIQFVVAFIANSQAMKADCSAMLVDSFTYFFNYMAEKRKQTIRRDQKERERAGILSFREMLLLKCSNHKKLLLLEIIPPLVSVSTLIIVTIMVMNDAIKVLIEQFDPNFVISPDDQKIPNLTIMLIFSTLNLILDLANVFFFGRAHHLYGYHVRTNVDDLELDCDEDAIECLIEGGVDAQTALPGCCEGDDCCDAAEKGNCCDGNDACCGDNAKSTDCCAAGDCCNNQEENNAKCCDDANCTANQSSTVVVSKPKDKKKNRRSKTDHCHDHHGHHHCNEDEEGEDGNRPKPRSNLNMCSAYTHVMADTLRSSAVLIAVIIVLGFKPPNVTPEEADSTAAVVVSLLILGSLIPLFRGMYYSIREFIRVNRIEKKVQDRVAAAASVRQQESK